jgi:hypothetical protein
MNEEYKWWKDKAGWRRDLRSCLFQGIAILIGLAIIATITVLVQQKYGLTNKEIYDYKAYAAMVFCAVLFVSWLLKRKTPKK